MTNGLKGLPKPGSSNGRTKHTNLSQKETVTSAEFSPAQTDRHDNAPSGYYALLLTPTLSLSLSQRLSLPHRWLLVSTAEGTAVLRDPWPHRRKSLLKHLLITAKSQTAARERSPGIRPCSNSKGWLNSPDKLL